MERLQGWNGTEPGTHLLGALGSVLFCSVSAVHSSCSHMFKQSEPKGKWLLPLKPPINPGVKTARRVKKNSGQAWLLSNNIFYFSSCFIHYLENKTHWINTNLESRRISCHILSTAILCAALSALAEGILHHGIQPKKQTIGATTLRWEKTHLGLTEHADAWSGPPFFFFYKTQREWIGTLIKCREHLETHRRWGRSGNTSIYRQKINKEKLGPRQLNCTRVHQATAHFSTHVAPASHLQPISPAISSNIVQYDMEYSPTADCTILYSVTNKHKQNGGKKVSAGWLAGVDC